MFTYYLKNIGNLQFKSNIQQLDSLHKKTVLTKKLKTLNLSILQYIDKNVQKLELCNFCNTSFAEYTYDIIIENKEILFKNIKLKGFYICNNKDCKNIRKKINANSYEFISKKMKISLEQAKILLPKINKSPFYKHDDESQEIYKARQRRDKNFYLNKYGNEIGEERWNEYRNKISISNKKQTMIQKYGLDITNDICRKKACTKERFIQLYGDTFGTKKYTEKNNKCKHTLQNFISRHGVQLGTQKYMQLMQNRRYTNSIEYYIEKYGETIGIQKYKQKIKSHTLGLTFFIQKYGEDIGITKYKNWVKRCTSIGKYIYNHNISSKQAFKFFEKLKIKLLQNKIIDNEMDVIFADRKQK